MRPIPKIDDPTFQKPSKWGSLDQFFLKFIRDERDLPFIYLCFKISFTLIPLGIILYTPLLTGWMWWAGAALHLVLGAIVFLGPYTLMLHNTSHRPFFKKDYNWANKYIPWVLGPFMGQSPDLYFMHHMGMHHSEGNMPLDKSSTMPYQRDSFIGFMQYYLRFMFIGVFELMAYFKMKNKPKFIPKIIVGEFSFLFFCVGMCFLNLGATIAVFVLPLAIIRFAMMSGNWGQHAFVDANEPNNDYKSSINCVNTGYNKKCFNDGYHIVHHLVPNMHWTDQPGSFINNTKKYGENKALVFEGIDFQMVWFFLMIKNYKKLAKHLIDLHGAFESDEHAIQVMKERTRKFSKQELVKFEPSLA
ncbi:MAG: fatty acid desaturase [Aureispira sp.]|nr:fatty acid desaturase [Aureispira sp.]